MIGSILGAAISAVANGIGSAVANKRKREAEEKYAQQQNEMIDDISREINSNYLDRADSRNAIRKLTDANTEAMRQLNTNAIRGGATDEAKVAMASQLNQRTADVVGDIAAIGEQHKDSLRRDRRSLLANKALHEYQTGSDVSGINTLLAGVGSAAQAIGNAWTKSPADTTTDTTTSSATIPEMTPQVASATAAAKKAVDEGDKWASKVSPVVNAVTPDMKVGDDFVDELLNRNRQYKYGQTM